MTWSLLFIFSPSLDICATDPRTERSVHLTVCKMYALECMGRKYSLTNAANCKACQAAERSCGSCCSWEKCEGERFFMILSEICLCEQNKVHNLIYTHLQWQWPCAGAAPPTFPAVWGTHYCWAGTSRSPSVWCLEYGRKEKKPPWEIVTEWAVYRKSLHQLPPQWVIWYDVPCEVVGEAFALLFFHCFKFPNSIPAGVFAVLKNS